MLKPAENIEEFVLNDSDSEQDEPEDLVVNRLLTSQKWVNVEMGDAFLI